MKKININTLAEEIADSLMTSGCTIGTNGQEEKATRLELRQNKDGKSFTSREDERELGGLSRKAVVSRIYGLLADVLEPNFKAMIAKIEEMCPSYGVDKEQVLSKDRDHYISTIRGEMYYYLSKDGFNCAEIARLFCVNKKTVYQSVKRREVKLSAL